MLCQEIMSKLVQTVGRHETVQEAARRMRDRNIGFLPVCDKKGRAIGVVTDRDLALRVCAENLKAKKTAVEDIMSEEIVSCRPTEDVRRAQDLMIFHEKSRIIIADGEGRPLGIVSLADIAAHKPPFAGKTLVEVTAHQASRTDPLLDD